MKASFGHSQEVDLRPPLLTAALLLALVDLLIAFGLRGLFRRRPARLAAILLLAALGFPGAARADDAFVVRATSELRLAYVRTGNEAVDATSRAGLVGLSDILNRRTAVETGEPMAVDIESRRADFLPAALLAGGGGPAAALAAAVERINRYLDTGGTILFDTRDGDEQTPGPYGGGAVAAQRLRRLVDGVKMPPLVPIAARPCADQVVLPDARVSRPLERRHVVGRAGRGPGQ